MALDRRRAFCDRVEAWAHLVRSCDGRVTSSHVAQSKLTSEMFRVRYT